MNRVLVDDAVRTTLGELRSQVEFYDQSGRVLGYFIPTEQKSESVRNWIRSRISDEELERRAQESGGLTTGEVLKKLRELDPQ